MSRFLLVFFLLYGGMHLYFYRKLSLALRPGMYASAGIALTLLLLTLAPLAVRVLEREGHRQPATAAAHVAYLWMGALFVFLCSGLLLDLWNLLQFALGRISGGSFPLAATSPQRLFAASLSFSGAVLLWGWVEARTIRIQQVRIVSPRIPASAGTIRIAQISDVHVGLLVRERRMRGIVEAVGKTAPDLLVSTGDLVDGQVGDLERVVDMFREIHPRYGKFAVTGNHEYYAGLSQALDFTRRGGFRILRGESVTVAGCITVSGADDPAGHGSRKPASAAPLLTQASPDHFRVYLKHRPVIDRTESTLYDLQLSGHVHGGQIFPFGLLTRLSFPGGTGLLRTEAGSRVYVSRGSGTWGPPIRFLTPPEVTLIELVPASPAGNGRS